MGLDFTSIRDREGAALYMLHTGNSVDLERLTRLKDDLAAAQDTHQVVLIDVQTPDGEKICEFYDIPLEQLPVAIIVQDDDSIAMRWDGNNIPESAADVAYQLNQISG